MTLPVRLDRRAAAPLGVQLAEQVRTLIVGGGLSRGDRLPSSRALATELGVARSVTEQAYEQLLAEGWLAARHGSGTFVASGGLPAARPPVSRRPATPATLVRLDAGTPWIDPRHAAGWRRAWREVSVAAPPRGYPDPRGLLELRTALAERLARTRGLVVGPDDIVITAGAVDGLRQLLPVLPSGAFALEDPGYRAAAETVRLSGRRLVDVPVGGVPSLRGVVGVYVTPAHQHPLGRV
ncbi:MAG: aminotransferase class I/II-fold pyridoxal phosphate-dependent enzyme, partial [Actinobacteria bacterium]|nr:aminotransferase class I/II-fold pyridoxal phosphate-dependent enzyme [Actinomycetota bacterium]